MTPTIAAAKSPAVHPVTRHSHVAGSATAVDATGSPATGTADDGAG
jgi:hypothetical protein